MARKKVQVDQLFTGKEQIREESITDFGTNAMTRYAIAVNLDRAVPELYDGLKPSMRRVAWAATRLGKNPYKSAKLVGYVLGNFHPHGDCLRADTKFYCLDGSIKTIKQLTDENKPAWVLSYNSETNSLVPALAHSWRIGQYAKKVYKIHLSDNSCIVATSNHQFLMYNNIWIKAEDLRVNDILKHGAINLDSRYREISLANSNTTRIYRLVKSIASDKITHHKDHNTHNDTPNNLIELTRAEHTKHHGDYKKGFDKGRKTMFYSTEAYRNASREKNIQIITAVNKILPVFRALKALRTLSEMDLELTPKNYESLRHEVYNLPYLETLQSNYGYSFQDLIDAIDDGVKADTTLAKGLTKGLKQEAIKKSRQVGIKGFKESLPYKKFIAVVRALLKKGLEVTWPNYEYAIKTLINQNKTSAYRRSIPTKAWLIKALNETSIQKCITKVSKLGYGLIITNIEIEDVNNEPMYDFTVDGLANAVIIPSGKESGLVTFAIAHNSSCYSVMQTMVHHNAPWLVGIGNWGNIIDEAAAYRYTNCCLSQVGWSCFDKNYIAVADMVPNFDDKDEEPVVIPVQLPFILLNGGDGIGVGVTCKLPTFTLDSVSEVLTRLFSGEKMNHQKIANILKPQLHWGGHFSNTAENREQWLQLIKTGRASIEYYAKLNVDEHKKEIEISEWPGSLNPEKFIQKVKTLSDCQRAYNSKGAETFKIEAKRSLSAEAFSEFVKKIQKMATVSVSYRVNVTHREAKTVDGVTTFDTKFLSLGISELILRWCKLRIELENKSLAYRIEKQQKAIDYSKLLIFASNKLDIIFKALRDKNSEAYLVKNLEITNEQAKLILDLKVRQLSKLDQDALKQTLKNQEADMKQLKTWQKNPKPKIKEDILAAVALAKKDKLLQDKQQQSEFMLK
jgi:hypothetical protein